MSPTLYRRLAWPLLRRMDAEQAHDCVLKLLALAQNTPFLGGAPAGRPVEAFGLRFPNAVGVAAGLDKNVTVAKGLAALGFGHVEVGTLTPRPQGGNPKPRVFRLPEDRALINRMGFPNCGVEAALPRLRALPMSDRRFILGVSLGKQKETPVEEAAGDYLTVMRQVYPYADYLAVNVSSPNTPGLRSLQLSSHLTPLLKALMTESRELAALGGIPIRPLLLKLAPDLTVEELDDVLGSALEAGIAGLIATNTTLSREGLTSPKAGEAGGMSGAPLLARSNEIIAHLHRQSGGRLPIIGVGGVFTRADLQAKLDAGATLVQVYSGLIYEGPGIARELVA